MARNIKYIVIHCTAGSMNQSAEGVAAFHTLPVDKNGRGWKVPGYHYLIEKDGAIKSLVPEDDISNGVENKNSVCINICYAGGIQQDANGKNCNYRIPKDTRTPAQRQSLIDLVGKLKKKYPAAVVVGHHYFANKACPSFDAGKEYGGIPASDKNLNIIATDPSKYAGGGYQATVEQVEQFKLAYEAVGKSLSEYPDSIVDQINQVYSTYKTIVDTALKMQVKIPITIPNPMEIVTGMVENVKAAGTNLKEDAQAIAENLTVVPGGTDIDKDKSIFALLEKMGIISILKDVISPATDFIKDAPAVVDMAITDTKLAVSGAKIGTLTAYGTLKTEREFISDDPDIQQDHDNKQAKSLLNMLDTAMESAGGAIQQGNEMFANGMGLITSTLAGAMNVGVGATAGAFALATGSMAAVTGVLTKIPGLIPKIIAAALSYAVSTGADAAGKVTGSVTNSVGNAMDTAVGLTSRNYDFESPEEEPKFSEPTVLSAPVSDRQQIYQEDFVAALNDTGISNTSTNATTSNATTNNTSSNSSSASFVSSDGKIDMDAMMKQLSENEEAAKSAVSDAIAEQPDSNEPHIKDDDEKLISFIESTADSVATIKKMQNEFIKAFPEDYQSVLYGEIRKGLLEILPKVEINEDSSKNFINMATFATLKITPAVIEYVDEKFKIIEERINTKINSILLTLNTLSASISSASSTE